MEVAVSYILAAPFAVKLLEIQTQKMHVLKTDQQKKDIQVLIS